MLAAQPIPFLAHVFESLTKVAKKRGHILDGFNPQRQSDRYQALCLKCGAAASVVCSATRYEKEGPAFQICCGDGMLQVMSNIIVAGQELAPPPNLTVENFLMAGIIRFKNEKRKVPMVTELILHETVTSSSKATVDVLLQRGLGVHFIIGSDGTVRQHADLMDDVMWHASEHNGPSVGIEVVNPYYPKYRPSNSPWTNVIDAPWAHEGKYVVPTPEQAEACYLLSDWLCSDASGPLEVPRHWVGLKQKRMMFGALPNGKKLMPGIHAHYYFGHADGCWLVLYCWLRMEAGCNPEIAYREANIRTTNLKAGWLDLSDFYVENPGMSEG